MEADNHSNLHDWSLDNDIAELHDLQELNMGENCFLRSLSSEIRVNKH